MSVQVLERERILEKLRAFFADEASVQFVYLYGSRALGFERPDSDVDIAAYFSVDPLHAPELEPDLTRQLGHNVQVINLNERSAVEFFMKVLPTAVVIKDSPERVEWEKEIGQTAGEKKVTQEDYLVFALDAMSEKNTKLREAISFLDQTDLTAVKRGESEAVRNFLGAFILVFQPLESIARRVASYGHLTKRVSTPEKTKEQILFVGEQLGISNGDMEPLIKVAGVRNQVMHAFWYLKESELTNDDIKAARRVLEELTKRLDAFVVAARKANSEF